MTFETCSGELQLSCCHDFSSALWMLSNLGLVSDEINLAREKKLTEQNKTVAG